MPVTLRSVTNDTFEECINLKVAEDQKGFVATNLYSLAEAKADDVSEPYAVYADEQMVGFIMYDFDPEQNLGYMTRLMIDEKYQGNGYGREAMRQVLDRLKAIPECREIRTGYMPGNESAKHLYESYGFEKFGVDDDGEIMMRLTTDPA